MVKGDLDIGRAAIRDIIDHNVDRELVRQVHRLAGRGNGHRGLAQRHVCQEQQGASQRQDAGKSTHWILHDYFSDAVFPDSCEGCGKKARPQFLSGRM
jgi:hypothetical protein